MNPLIVDIREILDAPGLSISVDVDHVVAELVLGDEVFSVPSPVRVHATVTNAGTGFVVTGRVSAEVTTMCSRCLCDFTLELVGELEGLWTREGDSADEDTVDSVSDMGTIDLAQPVMTALLVEAPFAPVHDEMCAGLCPGCGADLNVEPCTCSEVPDDAHPFSCLASLLEPSDDEDEST